jgi:hypothetical protein
MTRRLLLLIPLLAVTCGAEDKYACKTACGLLVRNPVPANWTCPRIQETEDLARRMFKYYAKDQRLVGSCESLARYELQVVNEDWWTEPDGAQVSGRTFCFSGQVKVNKRNPNQSSLSHEMAHILQDCDPTSPWRPCTEQDPHACEYHSNWDNLGIYEAINNVKGTPNAK